VTLLSFCLISTILWLLGWHTALIFYIGFACGVAGAKFAAQARYEAEHPYRRYTDEDIAAENASRLEEPYMPSIDVFKASKRLWRTH